MQSIGKHKALYIMVLPGILYFFVFHYLPMAGIVIAFQDFKPAQGIASIFNGDNWVGLKHFMRFFESHYFTRVFVNTVAISLLKLVFVFPMPIILALLLNEVRNQKFKRIVQSVSYLPHFLSWVIVASLIQFLLSPTTGFVNQVRVLLGLDTIFFLGSPDHFRSILVVADIWKGIGWGSIIYLASISGIDESLYEAATIDRANRLQQILYITLPGIRDIISIQLILNIGSLLNAGFEQVFLLYSPAVYNVADIIDTYVYREGLIETNYSFGTAVGFTKSVIALALVIATNKLAKKFDTTGLW